MNIKDPEYPKFQTHTHESWSHESIAVKKLIKQTNKYNLQFLATILLWTFSTLAEVMVAISVWLLELLLKLKSGFTPGLHPQPPQQPQSYVPPVRYLGDAHSSSAVPRFPLQQQQRGTMQRPTSSDANSTICSFLMQFVVVRYELENQV